MLISISQSPPPPSALPLWPSKSSCVRGALRSDVCATFHSRAQVARDSLHMLVRRGVHGSVWLTGLEIPVILLPVGIAWLSAKAQVSPTSTLGGNWMREKTNCPSHMPPPRCCQALCGCVTLFYSFCLSASPSPTSVVEDAPRVLIHTPLSQTHKRHSVQ